MVNKKTASKKSTNKKQNKKVETKKEDITENSALKIIKEYKMGIVELSET